METVFPPGWFNVMQYLLVYLPWEARVGRLVQFRCMYSQEKELKKLRYMVCNNARVEECITEVFTYKLITNFSSMCFSCANNVNAPTMRYHVVRDVPLSELSIFQWNGTCVGDTSAYYVTDKEWNYSMLYLYTNMVEVEPYFEKFDKTYWTSHVQPTLKQQDHMCEQTWAQRWSKLFKVVSTICNLSLRHFSFLILLHQSYKMCNVVYSFICSVCRMSMSPMT
jgi:hypothetical protein